MYRLQTFPCLLLSAFFAACTSSAPQGDGGDAAVPADGMAEVEVLNDTVTDPDAGLLLRSEAYYPGILLDAEGDINATARRLLSHNDLITYYYQRVGCKSDTCRQEFVTYAAVQYPRDSLLQRWMSGVLADFYYDATRDLDIKVNGQRTEDNGEGETELKNLGCAPYSGVLGDGGKQLFDYYQARLWLIGRDRDADVHGPAGRYGCFIYRCWQSPDVVSYFVGYSTGEPQWPVHYVVSFDRHDGRQLQLTDIVPADKIAEVNDMLADAAHERHKKLRRSAEADIAVESGDCNYSSVMLENCSVGLTTEGLAVSTGALPFDQWATATHVLVLPYSRINPLLVRKYRK